MPPSFASSAVMLGDPRSRHLPVACRLVIGLVLAFDAASPACRVPGESRMDYS
jgi:hypothetical protein